MARTPTPRSRHPGIKGPSPWLTSAVGNARWAGTPLAPILEEAQVRGSGSEVDFFGTDAAEEQVRDVKVRGNFARSMSGR